MGRKALPKLNPSVDLSRNFRTAELVPRPWDPEALFGRIAPLEIEVGCGKGLFLRNASGGTPERDFLGIEIAFKYAEHAGYRLAKEERTNAVMIHGDGQKLFPEVFPDGSAAAVHVYFPDPWWKKRHHRRRVMNETFSKEIERVLIPGGILHFWTDVEEYFDMTVELLHEHTKLVGPLPVAERAAEHDLDYRTHFERRMRKNDLDVFRSEFRKPE